MTIINNAMNHTTSEQQLSLALNIFGKSEKLGLFVVKISGIDQLSTRDDSEDFRKGHYEAHSTNEESSIAEWGTPDGIL